MSALGKIWYLLVAAPRGKLVILLASVLASSVLETIGVGVIFPFIKLIDDPSLADGIAWVTSIRATLGLTGTTEFLVATALGLLVVFVGKNAFAVLVNWVQIGFSQSEAAKLSVRMFRTYMHAPYAFHVRHNSGELIHNTRDLAMYVYLRAVFASLKLVTELTVAAGIMALLFYAQPLATLVAMVVLGVSVGAMLVGWGRIAARMGRRRMEQLAVAVRWLHQSLAGIREIKVLGREPFFETRYRTAIHAVAEAQQKQETVSQTPRLLLETIMVAGMLLVVILLLLQGKSSAEMIGGLALFGSAGFRLMPCMSRITVAVNEIRGSRAGLDELYADLMELETTGNDTVTPAKPVAFERRLSLEGVGFAYAVADRPALEGVDLDLPKGRSLGVVGSSGAGKSTLVNLLLGLYRPTGGRIAVDGRDVFENLPSWRAMIGYVPQSIFLADDTLVRNIAFGIEDGEVDRDRVNAAVEMAQLGDFVASLPDGLNTLVGENGVRLSGGQRQRIGIARALYGDPEVLVLDEATSALDNETENAVARALAGLHGHKTMVIVAHRLSTVKDCDLIAFMADGRVVAVGTFAELQAANDDFRRLVELGALNDALP